MNKESNQRRAVRIRSFFYLSAAMALAYALVSHTASAEVTDISALPVAKNEILVGQQIQYVNIESNDSLLAPGFQAELLQDQFGVTYGLTEKLTVGIVIPIVSKKGEFLIVDEGPSFRFSVDKMGLGDIQAGLRYTLFQWDRPAKTFRFTPLAGLKFPTGDSDDKGYGPENDFFPAFAQLGSGSWDPFLGFAWIYQTLNWQVDGAFRYNIRTEGTLTDFGDDLSLNAGFMHIIWPREISSSGNLYAGIEGTLTWQDKDTLDGERLGFTGGTRLFISPVIQYRVRAIKISAFVSFPVVQDLNEVTFEEEGQVITLKNPFEVEYVAGGVVILSF